MKMSEKKIEVLLALMQDIQETIRFIENKVGIIILLLTGILALYLNIIASFVENFNDYSCFLKIILSCTTLGIISCFTIIARIIIPIQNPQTKIPKPYREYPNIYQSENTKRNRELIVVDFDKATEDVDNLSKSIELEYLKLSFIRNNKNLRFKKLVIAIIITLIFLVSLTSCIKHWGLSGYLKCSAPHQLLQRQTGTKPAIPNVLYMYPLKEIILEIEKGGVLDSKEYDNTSGEIKKGFGILQATSYSIIIPLEIVPGKKDYYYTLTDTLDYKNETISISAYSKFNSARKEKQQRKDLVESTIDSLVFDLSEKYTFIAKETEKLRWGAACWIDGENNQTNEKIRIFTMSNINSQIILRYTENGIRDDDFKENANYITKPSP
jgi:hypothetical protein